jgi:hypothetical protein
MISIGHKLGLFKAPEVARRTDCAERYLHEWLNSQVAGGYIAYYPGSQTCELTPEQEFVLADEDGPVHFPPAWNITASLWFDLDCLHDMGIQWAPPGMPAGR